MPAAAKRITKTAPSNVITLPTLKKGEHYAGICLGEDGKPSHHLILLPGEAESVTWDQAKAWAAKASGELPTRQEQSLLFANLKAQFKSDWYWSGTQFAAASVYAWMQGFGNGNQLNGLKSLNYRARAVRRSQI